MFIDEPLISNIVFYPRKIANFEVLKFEINSEIIIGGFIFLKDKKLPTILLFHGNGEIALEYINFAEMYFKIGVNLAVIDFRGYGFSSGEPYYTSLISDAIPIFKNFLNWMDDHDMNDSIFIKGRSLGSVCASEIGSCDSERIKGIIFESGFGNLYNIMIKLFRVNNTKISVESLEEISNDAKMQNISKPVLIIHGTNDNIIPVEEAQVIYDSIPEDVYKMKVLIEGAGHNDISSFNPEKYFNALKNFIERYK